jgi:WhiB family transcriptional regulator, redox-sensing transcriptional regulator
MTVIDNRAEWWSLGACLSADPDLFFPISESGAAQRQVAEAKAVCAGCQVRPQCLSYALAAGPIQGVWGGTSEEERRLYRDRERAAQARAARAAASASEPASPKRSGASRVAASGQMPARAVRPVLGT